MDIKKKGIGFVALLLFNFNLYSQNTTALLIKDISNNRPIPYAKIIRKPTIYANQSGLLLITKKLQTDSITISAWNFADTTVFLNQLPNQDTVVIFLRPQPEQLSEVLVNPKNSWLQKRIYGFERWQNGWFFLLDKELVVTDDKLDILYKAPPPKPDGKIPKEMYADVLSNIYLVGTDSVQQLYITDTITYLYPPKENSKFEYLIKPLIGKTDKSFVYRRIKEEVYNFNYMMRESGAYYDFELKYPVLHNCGVVLIKMMDKQEETIYFSIDSSAYVSARDAFSNYVGAYIEFWKKHEHDGVFDPVLKGAYGSALHSYQHLFANYKHTYFQPHGKQFFLFDPYSKQLVTFNQKLEIVKKQPFDFTDCPREEYLYIDQATGQWWLQRRRRGLDILESTRPGDAPQSITLDPFVRNIRVHNNTVFYINEYGQFRVKKIEPKSN